MGAKIGIGTIFGGVLTVWTELVELVELVESVSATIPDETR